jgi:hypothetical protein
MKHNILFDNYHKNKQAFTLIKSPNIMNLHDKQYINAYDQFIFARYQR